MCHDCDWWESAKTAPKRIKVGKKGKSAQDALNMKLDYIIDQLGLVPPYVERAHHTHDVMYDDCRLVRCDCYSSAVDYVKRMQGQFNKPLRIVRVDIEI